MLPNRSIFEGAASSFGRYETGDPYGTWQEGPSWRLYCIYRDGLAVFYCKKASILSRSPPPYYMFSTRLSSPTHLALFLQQPFGQYFKAYK